MEEQQQVVGDLAADNKVAQSHIGELADFSVHTEAKLQELHKLTNLLKKSIDDHKKEAE